MREMVLRKYKRLGESAFDAFAKRIEDFIDKMKDAEIEGSEIQDKIIDFIDKTNKYNYLYTSDYSDIDYFKDRVTSLEKKYNVYLDNFLSYLLSVYKDNSVYLGYDIYIIDSEAIDKKINNSVKEIKKEQELQYKIYEKNINRLQKLFKNLKTILDKKDVEGNLFVSEYFAKNTESVYFSIKDYTNDDKNIMVRYSSHFPTYENYNDDKYEFEKVILIIEPKPTQDNIYRFEYFNFKNGLDEIKDFLEEEYSEYLTKQEINSVVK